MAGWNPKLSTYVVCEWQRFGTSSRPEATRASIHDLVDSYLHF